MRGTMLLEEPPEFELRGGLFYITDRMGDVTIRRAMRPHVFFATIAGAVEQSRKYRSAEIVSLPLHAASASGSPSK